MSGILTRNGDITAEMALPSVDVEHGVPVLTAKLRPPPRAPTCVARNRLLSRLSRGVAQTPVTLISGPAGAGKTVLASSWVHEQPEGRSIAWLTLDETDDDPATFWTYVLEALARIGVSLPAGEPPAPGQRVPGVFVSRLASALLTCHRPVVLVVDNADSITDRAIIDALDLLLRHAGTRLRLVLCARADPQLPLHQYRLGDALTEIRGIDLAFTAEETRQLLGRLGVPVSPEVAEALRQETEGWVVGLRLAAAPLRQGVPPERLVESLAQQDGSVALYMVAEVLDGQPASVRRFLLRISVTAHLDPDLVDRLGGRVNGRRVLAGLARANAFVEPGAGVPGGYRIHPLFREMLKAQLAFDHPRDVAEVHRICAAWYAEQGRVPEAVGHSIDAGDWSLAASLLIGDYAVARLLTHGTDVSVRVLGALPGQVPGPEAAVVRAAVCLAEEAAPAPPDLVIAARAAADRSTALPLRVSAAVVCAGALTRDGVAPDEGVRAVDLAESLLGGLPETRRREKRELTAVLTWARTASLLAGDAPDAALLDALHAALTAATAVGATSLRCRALSEISLIEALRSCLRRAKAMATEAESLWDQLGVPRPDRGPDAAVAAAWAGLAGNDHADARRWMARAQEALGPHDLPARALLGVLQSRLVRMRHEFGAAEEFLRPLLGDIGLPRWAREEVVTEAVRLELLRNRPAQVDALLQLMPAEAPRARLMRSLAGVLGVRGAAGSAPPVAEAGLPPTVLVEAEVLRACINAEAGSGAGALAALSHALELAEPEGLRWPFFDAPPNVRRLLRTQPQLAAAGAWLSPAGAAQAARPVAAVAALRPAEAVTQELSQRELEVLTHLAELLSTAEIAAAMFVSVNTVRTHIRSILRKLGVGRRNQAVRRARELGIL